MSFIRPHNISVLHLHMAVVVVTAISGCLSGPDLAPVAAGNTNALQISTAHADATWERTVAVLNDLHFMVARESKLEGVIETHPRAGSNLFEPWHKDSIGLRNRLESTVQSIRRRVVVSFQPASPGYTTVSVQVVKEIEDLPGIAANYEGGATFSEAQPLERDLNQVLGQSVPSRWLPRGTDPALQADIIRRIQYAVIR